MYEAYYGLNGKPFAVPPDPSFLFVSPQYRAALTMLEYGLVNSTLFMLLTGEVGAGKTLVVRDVISRIRGDMRVVLMTNTSHRLGTLLQWVCKACGIDTRQQDDVGLYQMFVAALEREQAAGRRLLLIVDEAQNLGVEVLEELRVLSNVNVDKRLLFQTILVGQPELREMLKRPDMRQFVQRIGVDYHLQPLSEQEAVGYVKHRLKVAGGNPELFSRSAIELAHLHSGGIPRLINQLCELALVYGYSAGLRSIGPDIMEHVIADRVAGGLFPSAAPAETAAPPPRSRWSETLRRMFPGAYS